jgi:hypothetical protein
MLEKGVTLMPTQHLDYVYRDHKAIKVAAEKSPFPGTLLADFTLYFYPSPLNVGETHPVLLHQRYSHTFANKCLS